MERLCRPWDVADDLYGNALVIGFMLVQCLDGVFTYIGIATFGSSIEANPLVSSAIAFAGPGAGLTASKLLAAACGIVLHLLRVHGLIAALTLFYLAVAIVPWAGLLLVIP
jgi:Domain of unknown function (DUF5658)